MPFDGPSASPASTSPGRKEHGTLAWSWLRGYRFEKMALLALVVVLAIAEASAINCFVTGLFGPITRALAAVGLQ